MVPVIFYFDGYDEIGLLCSLGERRMSEQVNDATMSQPDFFERAVHEGFVEIKDEAFATEMLRRHGGEQGIWTTVLWGSK